MSSQSGAVAVIATLLLLRSAPGLRRPLARTGDPLRTSHGVVHAPAYVRASLPGARRRVGCSLVAGVAASELRVSGGHPRGCPVGRVLIPKRDDLAALEIGEAE